MEADFGERKGEAGWSQWLEPQGRGWIEAEVGYGKEELVLSIKFKYVRRRLHENSMRPNMEKRRSRIQGG